MDGIRLLFCMAKTVRMRLSRILLMCRRSWTAGKRKGEGGRRGKTACFPSPSWLVVSFCWAYKNRCGWHHLQHDGGEQKVSEGCSKFLIKELCPGKNLGFSWSKFFFAGKNICYWISNFFFFFSRKLKKLIEIVVGQMKWVFIFFIFFFSVFSEIERVLLKAIRDVRYQGELQSWKKNSSVWLKIKPSDYSELPVNRKISHLH